MGEVGNDEYGQIMLDEMSGSGVDVSHIEKSEESTGVAVISVDKKGNNNIIVVPGANGMVDKNYIDRHREVIENCRIILAQHETLVASTEFAFKIA